MKLPILANYLEKLINFHVSKQTYVQGNCAYHSWVLVNVHKLGIIR